MEKFKISDIQEIFTSDVERFHSLTQQYVAQLLQGGNGESANRGDGDVADSPSRPLADSLSTQEALDEALRQCHTLKGLAATVEAWGLSCLGADFEKLLELAGSWVHNEREKANEVFQFILDHMQDWFVMNQFTCMDMLGQAWDVYQGLRPMMEERWPGYLPAVAAEVAGAQYVRLNDLELSEESLGSGVSGLGVAQSPEPSPETLSKRDGDVADSPSRSLADSLLDVQGAQPVAKSGAPLPVRVVPPTLRARGEGDPGSDAGRVTSDVKGLTTPDTQHPSPAVQADAPATPKPLQVVPPTLRRRDAAPAAPAPAPEEAAKSEAAPAASTIENVAASAPSQTSAEKTELPPKSEAKDAATAGPVAKAEAAGLPGAVAPPPIVRVAPPALKRRGKKAEQTPAATPSALPPEMPTEPVAASNVAEVTTPTPTEPAAAEALSAEAIFAALPETVAPAEQSVTPEAKSAEEFKPGADADLLELLSQEVAGYLTELTASLTALAGNLAAKEPWEKTRRLFHTIKGTAGTFGLDTVSAPAKAAEARCIVAVDEALARNRETFEACAHLGATIAKSLHLPFDEGRLREALELGFAQAANAAAASAPAPAAALDPEMAGFFINDTRDQIGIIEQAVLRWEKGEKPIEQVWAAQRGFHTIKGAGNSIGLTAVAKSVHEVESFLEELAGKGAKGSKAVFTFLLGAVDQLRRYLVGLARNTATPWRHDWSVTIAGLAVEGTGETAKRGTGETEGVADLPTRRLAGASDSITELLTRKSLAEIEDEEAQTIRIETSRLYQLMNLISEMVIDRARLARKIEQLAALHRALAERNGALTGSVMNFQEQFEFNLMQQAAAEAEAEKAGKGETAKRGTGDAATFRSAGASEFSELEFDRYDQFNVLARSLVEISHDIEQLNGDVASCLDSFAAENAHFTHTSQELQSKVTSLGLVPIKTLFPRLQRAFRDALDVEKKEAELVLTGGEATLDKVVVDKVYAPLLHLLRNAVAHGIENAATRQKRKKPAQGKVRFSAAQLSNQIVLQLSDDGGGVDAAAVRERAIEKGWLEKGSPELSPEQVAEFIFKPGFSTASKVTTVSGRGIGLDVVRKEVENLNGSVELKYVAGEGATWTLRLPLTLSISEAILAELGGTQYAFPLNFVEAGLILESEKIVKRGDGEAGKRGDGEPLNPLEQYPVERRDLELGTENPDAATEEDEGPKFDLLPVLRLSRLFGVPGNENSDKGLIASVGDRRAIVVVDVVLRRQEIVVKQLDAVMAQHPLLNGASVDAEGRVIPILNLPTLLKWGEGQGGENRRIWESAKAPSRTVAGSRTRVLVVDDSLSVRKVQERYFKDLGCQVTVASDGLVALEKLREQDFDLIFTDLEMPRLNGYELISEVRGNPAWSHVPVVVISSRGADKYITKAMNLGASTFLSKPFTQQQLRQVLGHYAKG
ncbi:MAG TPA: response regulator [Verrucomicrobiae bacterium]|nr:response regulator [Verrucomicrobiae bacterium]